MKKLVFIMAFCLLCGSLVGCAKESEEPMIYDRVGPPKLLYFRGLNDLRECYEILGEDDETVYTFLNEKMLVGPEGVNNKAELQELLNKLEGFKIPYPKEEGSFRFDYMYYTPRYSEITIICHKTNPNQATRFSCRTYDPQWKPPQIEENEVLATMQLNGREILLKQAASVRDALFGYYVDEQAQFSVHIPKDSVNNHIDSFILTDLRTLLFGEE